MTRIPLFLAMGLVWLAGASSTKAQDSSTASLLEQARPHLESVLGQRLEKPFRLRQATAADLQQVPDPELAAQVVWQFPDLHGDRFLGTAFQAAKEGVRSASPAVVDPRNGEILWQPLAPQNIAAWHVSLGRANSPAFAQLCLVHAVVCRHLEQQYHLARRWPKCRDAEEFQVLQSVYAGRAIWLTRQVAQRIGTDVDSSLLMECYRHAPEPVGDNRLKHVCEQVLRRKYTVAMEGLAFWEFVEQQNWPGVEQRMFEHPPTQLAWITRPTLYVKSQQSGRPSLTDALRRLEASLPTQEWKPVQQPWTPGIVRQVASLLGQQAQADKVLHSWEEARTLLWLDKQDPRKQVALSVARFENETAARGYFGFANELQRRRDEVGNAPDAGVLRVLDSRTSACTLRSAAKAVRFEKLLQGDTKAPPLTEKKILARCGDVVIEVAWYGVAEDLTWAEQVIAEVLKQ